MIRFPHLSKEIVYKKASKSKDGKRSTGHTKTVCCIRINITRATDISRRSNEHGTLKSSRQMPKDSIQWKEVPFIIRHQIGPNLSRCPQALHVTVQ